MSHRFLCAARAALSALLVLGLLSWGSRVSANVSDNLSEGCRLLLGGRWDQAEKAFQAAGREDITCPEALVGQGAARLLAGNPEAALDCFNRSLVIDSTHSAGHVGRGTAAVLLRNYDSALEDYRYTLASETPHHAAIRASEAHVACLLGLYDMAEAEARAALAEQPANELARQTLAAALIARRRPADALSALGTPLQTGNANALGIVAESPLYSASARYYADNGLDDHSRLPIFEASTSTGSGGAAVRGDSTFRIEWPKSGARLQGKTEISIYCAPEAGVQYVAVLIDEQFAGISNAVPFKVYVDPRLARNALCELRVDGYGAGGTVVKTASIMVKVGDVQQTLSDSEKAMRADVAEFLEGLLVLRAHPLLRAQLVGHALEAQGRLQEAVDAYEYAFSYQCTLPCIRTDLLLCYRKLGLLDEGGSHEIHSLPCDNAVALTFDDGPHPILTPWILDLLDKYHAKATFLLVGKQVELYPELTREILRRGHEIGCHSYTHSNLRQVSELGVERELVMGRQTIRRACGEFVTLFRPPGGNYDPQVRAAVQRTGFSTVFWTENITSYPGQTGPEILPKMLNKIGRSGIVLLHNGDDETRLVLPLLLPALAQRGLRMDTISALTSHRPFPLECLGPYPPEWKL